MYNFIERWSALQSRPYLYGETMQTIEKINQINRVTPLPEKIEVENQEEQLIEKEVEKKSNNMFPVVFQSLFCLAIIATLLVLYFFMPDDYNNFLEYYKSQGSIFTDEMNFGIEIIDEAIH